MHVDAIRTVIKEAIGKVSKMDPKTIRDSASFREDLGLDSLSILETIVEVQCRFKIPDVPDDVFAGIRTIDEAVRFVQDYVLLEVSS